jgi:hypothetical protein
VAFERDAVNELYDCGCDLVEAAAAIRRAAQSTDVAPAAPAVLGCIESAVAELAEATAILGLAADEAVAPADVGVRNRGRRVRMARGFAGLEVALRDACDLAGSARALTARALTRADVSRRGA